MTTSFLQRPLPSTLLQAVELLTQATAPEPQLGSQWFSSWKKWLEGMTPQPYAPSAMRLRHALALFAVQAIEDQERPSLEAIACIALYLRSLRRMNADELSMPMWQSNDDIDAAYALVSLPQCASTESSPWSAVSDDSVSSFLVMDVICGVIQTINLKVQPGTSYRHCAPLLVRLLNSSEWNPCEIIAHFRGMRTAQFELLNKSSDDLPGESHTIHGMLATYLFSYMHSSAWRPAASPYLSVLDDVVWDALCLTGLGDQAGAWLDTLERGLPNAGLGALRIPRMAARPTGADGLAPLTTICTPAFSSLRAYAAVASQDNGMRDSRAHWFERRYDRLAHAMGTLLLVLPSGARQEGDWDALNIWWRLDVQGLTANTSVQTMELPDDFE